jgi:pyridoxal phosphate enzyme (YggS family)
VTEPQIRDLLRVRLAAVEERISQACNRSGRSRADVTLVAVTKTVSSPTAGILFDLGVHDLGESRPQELWRKASELPESIRWHLIGHLQRNKIERTLPLVQWIHAVDSLRLLQALESESSKLGRRLPVLLEINASRESAKQGWRPEDLPALVELLSNLPHLEVRGLMTMAAYDENPENCRGTFSETRDLLHSLRKNVGKLHPLDQLSMGMSNDFETAIEEGATLVRLGSVLFEGTEESPS